MSEFPTAPLPDGATPPAAGEAQEARIESPPVQAVTEESAASPESGSSPATVAPGSAQVDVRAGKVLRLTAGEVHLDLGDGQQGTVPVMEFAGQPLPQIGDEVSVIVMRGEGENGQLLVSKRQADELSFWQTVRPGDILEGVVTGMNKGGLDIDIGGARAFLPSSQVDVRRIKDISTLIGEHVRCMVTQVDPTTRDLVVSRRKVIDKERKDKRAEALKRLEAGQVIKGRVSSITDFGAFVNVGDVEGLVHVTDMSWGRIRHPSEAVQVGDEVEVSVLKVDRGTGKVSLGMKQAKPDPWTGVENRYAPNTRVRGRVLRFADFGAFIELEEGLEALLPISEMSWTGRISHPSELLKLGDEVDLMILKVDAGKRRISLGLKQTVENPWDTLETQFPVQSTAKGKVSKILEFGAFVELLPGIEGLIHISELSDRRVKTVGDVVKEGQEVEVRILKIDRAAQRISLSMKPPPRLAPAASERETARQKKQRKRPLRGGLSSHFEW